jgi:ACS family tartrate transporter-like MFS transporter
MRKVSWRLVPFVMLLYFIAFLDRVNVGFAALTMNRDLGLSATVFGTGAGIFFLGYLMCEVPSNLMLDKLGARIWIARIMITWGLISAGMAFTQGPRSFYALRFFLGCAEGGFFPGILLYLTYWFPASYRGKVVSAYMVAIPLSNFIGAPISGALLGLRGWGLRGWQYLFILEGLPAVLLGLFVLYWMTDNPEKAEWLAEPERQWLVRVMDEDRKTREAVHHFTLREALLHPRVLLLGLVHSGMLMSSYGINFWMPQIFKGFGGLTNFQVGLLSMIPWGIATIGMYLWGWHSDKTHERIWHVVLAGFATGIGLALSGYLGWSPPLALTALTLATLGIMAMLPVFWTLPTALLTGRAAAGAIGLISAIGNLGSYFGPFILGYMKDRTHSHMAGLIMVGVYIICCSILALVLGHNPALEKKEIQ